MVRVQRALLALPVHHPPVGVVTKVLKVAKVQQVQAETKDPKVEQVQPVLHQPDQAVTKDQPVRQDQLDPQH